MNSAPFSDVILIVIVKRAIPISLKQIHEITYTS